MHGGAHGSVSDNVSSSRLSHTKRGSYRFGPVVCRIAIAFLQYPILARNMFFASCARLVQKMIKHYEEKQDDAGMWHAEQGDEFGNIRRTVGQFTSREELVCDMAFGKIRWTDWQPAATGGLVPQNLGPMFGDA